jgi:hypothetical protein
VGFAIAGTAALALSLRATDHDLTARFLAAGASTTLLIGGVVAGGESSVAIVSATSTIAMWALAELLDRRRAGAGTIARFAAALPLVLAIGELEPAARLATTVAATILAGYDGVRLRRLWLLVTAAFVGQLVVYDAATAAGLSPAQAGVALCVAAVVWATTTTFMASDARPAGIIAAALGVVVGIDLAALEPAAFAAAVMIVGALVMMVGARTGRASIVHGGAAIATLGLFGYFVTAGLAAPEWYVTPVAVQMLVAGWQLRLRERVSSWVAYGTTLTFLGGTGLLERISGGSAGHALFAGVVGILAVAVGGWRRLSAPLVVGTALLVAISAHESLSSLAGVATWMWFALGGAVLIGVGVALERHDQGPVEAGRRLVEVLGERFA